MGIVVFKNVFLVPQTYPTIKHIIHYLFLSGESNVPENVIKGEK